MDGHVSLFGALEPVNDLLCRRQFRVKGSILASNVAGALGDGGGGGPSPLSSGVTIQPSPAASLKDPSVHAWHSSSSLLLG
jgi:hypothetical protein